MWSTTIPARGTKWGLLSASAGIDNANYYRPSPEDPRYYQDFTGCGPTP